MKHKIVACFLTAMLLNLTACTAVPDEVKEKSRSTDAAEAEFKTAPISEISAQADKLSDTVYGQFTLPKKIYINPNIEPCSFNYTELTSEKVVFEDFFKTVTGVETDSGLYEKQEAQGIYKRFSDDRQIYFKVYPASISAVNNLQSVSLQCMENFLINREKHVVTEFKNKDFADFKSKNSDLISLYEKKLSDTVKCMGEQGFDYSFRNLFQITSSEEPDYSVNYFEVELSYKGLPLNYYAPPHNNDYADGTQDIYRAADFSYLSFINDGKTEEVGALELSVMSEPKDVKTYAEVCSLESALSLLSASFSDKLHIEFEEVSLVLVGDTKDYTVEPNTGEFFPEYKAVYNYHPMWLFITTPETAIVRATGGRSGFFVDALTGEINTYTEPVKK